MSGLLLHAQKIIFDRLTTEVSATVYDDVPDLPEGQPDENFPYVAIGDDLSVPWEADDMIGEDITVMFHIWSRYQGKKETKTIMREIFLALNRQVTALQALAPSGVVVIDCLHEFSQIFELGDGATRHGVCRFRLRLVEE